MGAKVGCIAYSGFWRQLMTSSPRVKFRFQPLVAPTTSGTALYPRQSLRAISSCREARLSEPYPVGTALSGTSGRIYNVKKILVDRRDLLLCVYRASCEGRDFIIKNAIDSYEGDFEYPQKLQADLAACPNLRTMIDTVPDSKLYVYPFMTGDLLQFSQRPLSEEQRKYILKSALTGLAELHDRNIFHTDIKPNNILLNYKEEPDGKLVLQDVKLADLEDAVQLKRGAAIRGCVLGNKLWRSPEAWTGAVQGTPSDVFSFGVVAIYVMTNEMVLYYAFTDEQVTGDEAWRHILHRHVDLFAVDTEDLMGLLEHVGGEDSPWYDRIADIAGSFSKEEPRRPFALHTFVDEAFRDLVVKMTNLDPKRRITAREALAHPWFTQTRPGRYYPSKA